LRKLPKIDSPMDKEYNYHQAFKQQETAQLKTDMQDLLTQSQDWWTADFGNYGPFFIRLSRHDSGTDRIYDGRGGANRG
ncbi:catalase-peroxidase, partial [Francisella tularensis subsp. holarctica]|nr:catalase-peroxidase [Francisella tularensis subsp. holarctica]